MTYNAEGSNPPATRSVFFRFASAPWGKWSDPQPIYNACSNGGFGIMSSPRRAPVVRRPILPRPVPAGR
jgi:hypothetical protein